MSVNYIIYAMGQRGDVLGKVFVPYREQDGTFPIFSEALMAQNKSDRIQKSENKVGGVRSIGNAVSLIRQGGYRWRLKDHESGQSNIFKPEHIVVLEV